MRPDSPRPSRRAICSPSGWAWLDRVEPGFTGSDPNGLFDVGHEDLAVADSSGLGCAADGFDRRLDQLVGDDDLDLYLGQEVNDVFRAPVELRSEERRVGKEC